MAIQSAPGQGTTFSISLPLTPAVLVRVAELQLVVPITAIIKTPRPSLGHIQSIGPTDRVLAVRGTYVPITDICHALGFRGPPDSLDDAIIVEVEGDHDTRVALAVDRIQDQRQLVMPPPAADCRTCTRRKPR